jgi:glycosyltransferase involved in cell wall biosynthesis
MTRVAILGTRGYPSFYGGFETAVRRLAPHLADSDFDVTVYGRPGTTDRRHEADTRVKTVTTRGFQTKSLSTLSFGLTSFLHAFRSKPDVALIMNVANGYWLPLLKLRGIPTVVNVDGMEWKRAKWGRLAKAVFMTGAKLTARWADHIVVDAEAIGDIWAREFGREGVFIPYGGDVPPPLPLLDEEVSRGSYVLLVARFVPENTVASFFDAVPALAERCDVVIVGSSGFGGELDDRAAALSETFANVHWLGHVNNDSRLFALWQNAGAYFHGHSVGGTNPALVQAMAAGAPVVARDTVYNREVLGRNAEFVEDDPIEIARAVVALIEDADRRRRWTDAGVERARDRYSWNKVCDQYVHLLRIAAAKNGRPGS